MMKILKIQNRWMSLEEHQKWVAHQDNFWANYLFGNHTPRIPKEDDNVKLAWVTISGNRTMAGVDNQTMKGYKLRADVPTWELPLIPLDYDHFERWCTSFDV